MKSTLRGRVAATFAALALSVPAVAVDSVKILIPANPGGGWDTTGRELGKAMQGAGSAKSVQYDNKGGAGGTIGLAQFVNSSKGDPGAMMMTGMVAHAMGVEPAKVNYVPFKGGGEATAAIIGAHVTAGISGYGEFAQHIKSGKMRALAISSAKRLPGIDIPTLKEQGYDVELANWRGIVAPPGITPAQRAELIKAVEAAVKSQGWKDTLKKQEWDDYYLAGDPYTAYIDSEMKRLSGVLGGLSLK